MPKPQQPCSPTMRRLLRYLLSLADTTGATPAACADPLFEWAGIQPRAGKIALGRLLRENYLAYQEAGVCDEHQVTMWFYRILPHVRTWLKADAPYPGPPAIPTITIQCPRIFVTLDYPDAFERN